MWLRENDEVPCDLVLIGTSDPQGVCYVEVSIKPLNLDRELAMLGEANRILHHFSFYLF